MAKNRKRDRLENNVQPSPRLINEMRGLVQATRPRSGLRSLTPTEAKARIDALYQEVKHEYKTLERKIPKGEVQRAQISGRSETNKPQVRSERVPAPVRDLFQGARRAVVCSARETRREVMHAMRRTGKAGARRNRKARWSSDSRITCKGR